MKKILGWGIAFLIVFLGVFIYYKFFFTYSEGYRAGLLQKFSYRGNLFKTWEGEMILSSVESSRNVPLASEKFFFSVDQVNVVEKLKLYEGRMIVVHYNQKHGVLMWRGESQYLIDSVRLVTELPERIEND
jgi:hypothetical protein